MYSSDYPHGGCRFPSSVDIALGVARAAGRGDVHQARQRQRPTLPEDVTADGQATRFLQRHLARRVTDADPRADGRRDAKAAEAIDGFVEWRDGYDGLTYWGFVVFASPEAALAWKGHPTHGAIHQQGEDSVYSAFGTQVFELVREGELAAR